MADREYGTRESGLEILGRIFEASAGTTGENLLQSIVQALGETLGAETTFIARALDFPTTRVRGIAAWKDGEARDEWEFSLEGNPCQLTYRGNPTFIPCDVATNFAGKRDSGYNSFIGVPLFNADQTVIGHLAVYSSQVRYSKDFSQELVRLCGFRAEAELRNILEVEKLETEVNTLKSAASYNEESVLTVAHDLRSPLTAVMGFLDIARKQNLPDQIEQYLIGAREGADRLLLLINDYLDLQRISNAAQKQSYEAFSILSLVDEAVEEAQILGELRGVVVDFSEPDGDVLINGDKKELRRVLDNLLSNAIDHSPNSALVNVELEDNGNSVRVRIRDQGPGVPEGIGNEIFEPFNRAVSVRYSASNSGLGLAIAFAIIARHGGNISFENKVPGTEFFFDLPAR